jgi:hypothetical protein
LSRSCSTFRSATTFAGIRCRTTREIRIRVTIIAIAMMVVIIVAIGLDTAVAQADEEIGMTMDHGVA